MKAISIRTTVLSTFIFLSLLMAAYAPKCMINGRVVDAETQYPIKGAAVAIRWYEDHQSNSAAETHTIEVNQDLSDGDGQFKLSQHPDKNYVMGVYKEGYICWSSRSSFSKGSKAAAAPQNGTHSQDEMVVELERLKGGHSEEQHASFTVLVAEEVTASKKSPFYEAIKPLFKRWRDNLREEFRKTFQKHKSPEPN